MNRSLELVFDAKATLGEGAFWDVDKGVLDWVDIDGKKLHIYDPDTRRNLTIPVKGRIGTVVPMKNGGYIYAEELQIVTIDEKGDDYTVVTKIEGEVPKNRLNDGKCDPAGRLWVGTMDMDRSQRRANLYRIDRDFSCTKMVSDLGISNGIVWSLDAKKMYFIDTPTGVVVSYDYNNQTGEIADKTTVITVPESMGHPDGMTIDSEGMLWIALFGGSAVGRWNPKTGDVLETVTLPVKNITSCALGGKNLDELYITSARTGLSRQELETQPTAGGLFRCKVEVPGLAQPKFDG